MISQPDPIPVVQGWMLESFLRSPSPMELTQIIIAILGAICSLVWVVSASRGRALILKEMRRQRDLDRGINGGLELIASGNLRQELLRFMTHLLVLLFGLIRLWLPLYDAPYREVVLSLRIVLMMLTSSLFLMGLFEWMDRRALDVHDRDVAREAELRLEIVQSMTGGTETGQTAQVRVATAPEAQERSIEAQERSAQAHERSAEAHERAATTQVEASGQQATAADMQVKAAKLHTQRDQSRGDD